MLASAPSSDVEPASSDLAANISSESPIGDCHHQILSLTKTLKQRDKEIAILVDMIKKGRTSDISDGFNDINRTLSQGTVVGLDYCDPAILSDAATAFSWFCSKYPGEEKMREDKELLKSHVTEVSFGNRHFFSPPANHLSKCYIQLLSYLLTYLRPRAEGSN